MYKPSIRQIEYFLALSDMLSFSKTAEQLNITQSALSNSIQEMENGMQIQLFERSSRRVFLTEGGKFLREKFTPLIESYQLILAESESLTQQDIMNIRLGVIPTIAPYLLPQLLQEAIKTRPPTELSITEALTRHVLEKINLNQIDIGIIALPYNLGSSFKTIDLFEDKLYLAVPETEKDRFPDKLTPKDIKDLKLLLLEDGHCLREQAISACHISSPQIDGDFAGSSLPTVLSLVGQRQGYSLVPEMLVKTNKPQNVTFIPFKEDGPKRVIALVWAHKFSEKKANQMAGIITQAIN